MCTSRAPAALAFCKSCWRYASEAYGFCWSPGDTLTLKVRNRGGERELKWKVGSRQEILYQVKDLENISPEQHARRAAWLKGEAQGKKEASGKGSGTRGE